MYKVQDWAEVHRLFHRERWTKTAIAGKLGMSRNTVASLLAQPEPPAYERAAKGSLVDPFDDAIAAMLAEDPKVAATVILERLRPLGYVGGISILKERVAEVRPSFAAARAYQRTSYLPGEVGQFDWWPTGRQIPVGKGATREAFGLVATLPHSAAQPVCSRWPGPPPTSARRCSAAWNGWVVFLGRRCSTTTRRSWPPGRVV